MCHIACNETVETIVPLEYMPVKVVIPLRHWEISLGQKVDLNVI